MSKTDQELHEFLRKLGVKVTPQRMAIIKMVLSTKDHPSANQIFEEIKKVHPAISQATVYKTLTLLKELGLVSELSFNNNHSRYDPNKEVHINIICSKCGQITDYESETTRNFWKRVVSEIGKETIGQRLDLYITCDKCENV